MSLNDSMSPVERAKLAVWDYPVSDKYTKMWQSMQEAGLPTSLEGAVERVRKSTSSSEGFAYIGECLDGHAGRARKGVGCKDNVRNMNVKFVQCRW